MKCALFALQSHHCAALRRLALTNSRRGHILIDAMFSRILLLRSVAIVSMSSLFVSDLERRATYLFLSRDLVSATYTVQSIF